MCLSALSSQNSNSIFKSDDLYRSSLQRTRLRGLVSRLDIKGKFLDLSQLGRKGMGGNTPVLNSLLLAKGGSVQKLLKSMKASLKYMSCSYVQPCMHMACNTLCNLVM